MPVATVDEPYLPMPMDADSESIAAWVAREVLPHEGFVRNWLRRHWESLLDIDDVVQGTYCRLSELKTSTHIQDGRAYFFTTARSVAIDMVRLARVANVRTMTETDWLNVIDDSPTPDRFAEAGRELARVEVMLSRLSCTCRQVIELRRIHGLSQAETAQRLGVSENVVENHIVRGLRNLSRAMEEQDALAIRKVPKVGRRPLEQSQG